MSKTYEQGMQDAIELYGRVCSSQGSCPDCLIGQLKGEGVACQEFMRKFPGKMISLLTEMDSDKYTYYNEYITRFPNCTLDLKTLSEVACRKSLFEGYIACDGSKSCEECWNEVYEGDITMVDE